MTNNDHIILTHDADPNAQDSINCLLCHRVITGRHVITYGDHYCPSCGDQLVRIGVGQYVTERVQAEVAA